MASQELQAALDAAQAAAEVIRSLYQKNITVKTKSDASPVTEADVRAEEVIKEVLSERFPTYGFYGEETGKHSMGAENVWLVDPIDGTKSFVRDCPFFSTQIALIRAGQIVVGVSSAPAYGELAWAESGGGAFMNDRAIRVSTIDDLSREFPEYRWLQRGALPRRGGREPRRGSEGNANRASGSDQFAM